MTQFKKVRSILNAFMNRKTNDEATGPLQQDKDNQSREAGPSHQKTPPLPQESEDSDDDFCGALTEVAAPEPVERMSEAELARHPSLEQGYADSRDDPYGALSEIAAPGPVERCSEEEMARHPSLERRLSRISHC
ncbi:uncharacterized protein N7498_009201 [Penicillium cinerascens]|uniref:Uncharacterized protein n=1 Tax=Penicillium cinerascens TaxID=70096 RepID=A0A9W9J9K8_9EURO|nr:uncharacterized protein N7498_009201 [Penicillium cinerascens]KAJ5190216.1 hypothetical protein N7498_009201 [Penicillium cinerascens]